MTLVIEINTFIDILGSMVATAGNDTSMDGVFLYTAHGAFGDEPGQQQLLAGLATNGVVSSHYYRPVDGGDFKPQFWPSFTVGLVSSAFGSRAADAESEHVLRVKQLPDHKVEITEYDNPADGVKITFNVLPADTFPSAGVVRLLEGKGGNVQHEAQDHSIIDDSDSELWDMASLGALLRLSKSWKAKLVVTKGRTGEVYRAQMTGIENWLGAVVPVVPEAADVLNDGVAVETHLDIPKA
ncbi:hypothetical protein KG112_18225 [Nocardioides sp. zg-ZUI104]|uniref:hypothetical protein n=1 Tax=Nocardioides faecalis TaxID=2803858 RepID=UPI001BCE8DFF|nr:hypothetical protein [Nocardioides faecalis]MBS4754742.1 hypothetical protein [Nocardioides faecalis]